MKAFLLGAILVLVVACLIGAFAGWREERAERRLIAAPARFPSPSHPSMRRFQSGPIPQHETTYLTSADRDRFSYLVAEMQFDWVRRLTEPGDRS